MLIRIHADAARDRVFLTAKAEHELDALGLGLDPGDVRGVADLTVGELAGRYVSRETGEWMYVFKPHVAGSALYVKLVLRNGCLVISFHEDEGHAD